jgi:hypothetical protein
MAFFIYIIDNQVVRNSIFSYIFYDLSQKIKKTLILLVHKKTIRTFALAFQTEW